MNNEEIKKLIVDSLNQQHDLCNQHSESIGAIQTELPLIRQSVEKLVAVSEKWMNRTVNLEKEVVAIKASKKAYSIILGIALTVAGILAGVFGKSIAGIFDTKKEEKADEKYIYMYSDINSTANRVCQYPRVEKNNNSRSSKQDTNH